MSLLSEIIAAIFGGLLGFIASFLTLRLGYKRLFAETVSSNRMDWINVWRVNISKLISCAKILHEYNEVYSLGQNDKVAVGNNHNELSNKLLEYEKEYFEARAMITSRLNLTEDKQKLLYTAILDFDYSKNNETFNTQCELIEELVREILKPEWERVKKEAKGKHKK